MACLVLAAMMFCGQSEARPRDPVGQFFAGIGKAFEPATKTQKRQKSAKGEKGRKGAKTPAPRFSASVPSITVHPLPKDIDRFSPPGTRQDGLASWYGPGFHGRPTACGAIRDDAGNRFTSLYNEWRATAAHRTLRCGTLVEVHSAGKSVTVTITDRGPFIPGRIIDLSRGAAQDLGMIEKGTARVSLYVLGKD